MTERTLAFLGSLFSLSLAAIVAVAEFPNWDGDTLVVPLNFPFAVVILVLSIRLLVAMRRKAKA